MRKVVRKVASSRQTAFHRLSMALVSLRDPARVEQFLREILTPCEQHDLGLRWELVELLSQGIPQRKIGTRLGISLCKITRGAKILKEKGSVTASLVSDLPREAPVLEPVKPAVRGRGEGRKNGTRVTRKS